jgi:hypothetical protein
MGVDIYFSRAQNSVGAMAIITEGSSAPASSLLILLSVKSLSKYS